VGLRTANGDVTLTLPPTTSAQLDLQTNVGVIQTKGLSLAEERFMPRDAGGQYTARLGTGEATIEVQVQNGSILVQSATVTEQETPVRVDTAATNSVPADSVAGGVRGASSDTTAAGTQRDTTANPQLEQQAGDDTTQPSPSPDTGSGR
jgi:hypothetical protein